MGGDIRGEIKGEDYPDMSQLHNQTGSDENRLTISILKDKKIIDYLQGFKESPVLLVYRVSEGLVKTFAEHDWTVVGSDYNTRKKCDNKTCFNKILSSLQRTMSSRSRITTRSTIMWMRCTSRLPL